MTATISVWVSIFSGFAAAIFWWRSARVSIPDVRDNLNEFINDLQASTAVLREQARLSRNGALFAAAAVFFQATASALESVNLAG